MICYYFYKNILLVFTEYYFAIFNGFSGQIYFADWLAMLYNALWTSWHCLFAYILERDVFNHKLKEWKDFQYKIPQVYIPGQKHVHFSFFIFWEWILLAFFHGGVVFTFIYNAFAWPSSPNGQSYDHWFQTTTAFTLIIHILVYKLLI